MNYSMQPGWYPDPNNTAQLRWWDGTAWTDNVAPKQQTPESPIVQNPQFPQTLPSSEPASTDKSSGFRSPLAFIRGHKKMVVATLGVFMLGIVGVVAAIVLSNGDTINGSRPGSLKNVSYTEITSSDEARGLDFTATVVNAPRGENYEFNLNDNGACSEAGYALFSNAALTEPVGVRITNDADDGCIMRPNEESKLEALTFSSGDVESEGVYYVQSGATEGTSSGLGMHDRYYLVRYYDESGGKLERPVVTGFVMADADLDTPTVIAEVDVDNPGETLLSWNPVEGADKYLIVLRSVSSSGNNNASSSIVGTTEGASWSTAEYEYDEDALASLGSAAGVVQKSQNEVFGLDGVVDVGVIAVNAAVTESAVASGIASINAASIAQTAPYELEHGYSTFFFNAVADIPKKLGVTMVSGDVKEYPTTILKYSRYTNPLTSTQSWEVVYSAAGTLLGGEVILSTDTSEEALVSQIHEYNSASIAASGSSAGTVKVLETLTDGSSLPRGTKDAPDTNYPYFGTTAFSRYLAQHIVAGTDVIDISEWRTVSGQPGANDALQEAIYQNPYAMVKTFSIVGTRIAVKYQYPLDEMQTKQQALLEKTQAIASAIPDGSKTDKLRAAYNGVMGAVTYDDDAFNLIKQRVSLVTELTDQQELEVAESQFAYTALVDGSAVCTAYAQALKAVAHEVGIDEVMVVTGGVKDSNVGHAWNRIQLDGKLYDLDATWDDAGTGGSQYFLVDPASLPRYVDIDWIADTMTAGWLL